MSYNTFPMVAKTLRGLEDVLRDELLNIGAANVEIGNRMVSFEGNKEMMYRANICCRTALFILKPIVKFTASDPDELYDAVRDIEWDKYLSADSTFSIDATINSSDFPHSKYAVYRVKDGIADYFFDKYGHRPNVCLSGADREFNIHISDKRVTISLNSSGEPLNQRGYRSETTGAPLNEVLAAGIILKTGWNGDCDFADPMCGSGTLLIEAALIARNINPGIFRKHFAFEKWEDFDADLLTNIYNDDSEEKKASCKIYGGDINPEAVMIAKKNIKAAGVDDLIELKCADFAEWEAMKEPGVMVTNPPYGERIKPSNIEMLYSSIGTTLKTKFSGWHAWILGYKDEHFAQIGLRPSVKFPILNGNLECSLREYVLFSGPMDRFKSSGGSTANKEFNRDVRPARRHISDKDWKREEEKFDHPKHIGKKNDRRDNRKRAFADGKPERSRRDDRNSTRFPKDHAHKDRDFTKKRTPKKDFNNPHSRGSVFNDAPSIPADNAVVFSPIPVRSRKGWRKPTDDESDNS